MNLRDLMHRKTQRAERTSFPVNTRHLLSELARANCPASVPYALVEAHERQAQANHLLPVARLADRRGLCPSELVAVLSDKPWTRMDDAAAVEQLKVLLAASAAANGGAASPARRRP